MSEEFHAEEEFEEGKSKSQIKREMEALQALGKTLTELKPAQLKEVPISEELAYAIEVYNKINQREGKRRQMQFIGKLMRDSDHEAIQAAVDLFDSSSKAYAQQFHQLEAWRTRLIDEGNDALSDFIEAHDHVDVQHLRQLVRNAKKDVSNNKNTGAAKKLFQYLKGL